MAAEELREKMLILRTKIASLQWDKEHNQLNSGKAAYFENIKKEFAELEQQMKTSEPAETPETAEERMDGPAVLH